MRRFVAVPVHPGTVCLWAAIALGAPMASPGPAAPALSAVVASLWLLLLEGPGALGRRLSWCLPLLALAVLVNPLFAPGAAGPVLGVGPVGLSVPALVQGLTGGLMFVMAVLWLSVASSLVPVDDVVALLGDRAPTLGLMASMVMRTLPDVVRRWQGSGRAARACTAAGDRRPRGLAAATATATDVLVWTLDDSVCRAESMRARGWGSGPRTRLVRRPWRPSDVAGTVALALAGVAAAAGCALGAPWSLPLLTVVAAAPLVLLRPAGEGSR